MSHQSGIYKQLDDAKDEIRLLKIQCTQNDAQGYRIKAELLTTTLASSPEYHALSYTWASDLKDRQVLLSGSPTNVGGNLEEALWELSQASIKIIWADALCINQQDLIERSQQVKKMRQIYSGAYRVVVWLGPAKDDDKLAFDMINELKPHLEDHSAIKELLKQPLVEEGILALKRLIEADYWQRVWVIQEVMFASKILIFRGGHTVEWEAMESIQRCLTMKHIESIYASPKLNIATIYMPLGVFGPINLNRSTSSSDPLSLLQSLCRYRGRGATDPKDKVFALLGITNVKDSPFLVIDYSLSVEQVYVNVFEHIAATTGDLNILCSVGSSTSRPKLPSWATDWAPPDGIRYWTPRDTYHAGRSTNVAFSVNKTSEEYVLSAKGSCIGAILSVASFATSFDSIHLALAQWISFLILNQMSNEVAQADFGRTLLLDQNAQLARIHEVLGLVSKLLAVKVPSYAVSRWLAFYETGLDNQAPGVGFSIETLYKRLLPVLNLLFAKRIFLLQSLGRKIMGLGFQEVAAGDKICVLYGCSMPVILRQHKDGHYIFMGCGFISEFMDGQAAAGVAQGYFNEETFEIR